MTSDKPDTENCQHALSDIERRGDPDWKNNDQTIWYRGFCRACGADVEVEYQFDRTVEYEW